MQTGKMAYDHPFGLNDPSPSFTAFRSRNLVSILLKLFFVVQLNLGQTTEAWKIPLICSGKKNLDISALDFEWDKFSQVVRFSFNYYEPSGWKYFHLFPKILVSFPTIRCSKKNYLYYEMNK